MATTKIKSAANLAEAESNIIPSTTDKTITPSQSANTFSADSGNGMVSSTPTNTIKVNSYNGFLNDMYDAQRGANLNALEAEYNNAIGELDREKTTPLKVRASLVLGVRSKNAFLFLCTALY